MKRWPRSKITGWILLASFQFANRTGASRVPDWSILGPVLKPETICRLRGGSIKIPDSRKQLRRKQGLSIHQSSTDEVAADADSEMHASRDAVNDIVVPIIEAILIPRSITLTTLVRWVTLLAAAVSFIACIRTAGTTYVSAIWATLHPDADVPPGVKVSPLDETIAHYITEASRDMLPPRFLPSPGPLISFVTSLSTWVTFSVLLPRWFTHVCVFMNYHRTRTDGETLGKKIVASHLSRNRTKSGIAVLVEIPREQREFENDGRSHAVRPLLTSPPASDFHPLPFYFDMNHRRIYCDVVNASARCVDGGPSLHSTVPIRELLSQEKLSGLTTISRLSEAQARYGPYASLSIQQPTILLAFCNRLASPLSVFQFLGKLLTALEETLLASFLGLASTLLHHYWNARQSIVSARELAIEVQGSVEGASLRKVWVLRPRTKKRGMRWKELSAVDLLPGDIFILGLTDNETFVPADALLLEGRCIVNESVLTGESVPQAKVPLDVDLDNAEEAASPLDLLGSHRNSILFAGTSLFYCAIAHGSETSGGLHPSLPTRAESKVGDKWIKLLALRTGAYSSRGDLLRALSKSGGHVGAIASPQSEKDAIWLVGSLSAFAVVACASLFQGNHLAPKNPSSFRRVVQCTRIAIASIPSDLPLILSSIAHSCASVLRMEADVACTEPGSLLTAAHVGTVVFDKTGTLTADTQSLSCVLPPAVDEAASPFANAALAGCHSLVHFGGNVEAKHLAGDPLDRASFEYSGWSSNGTEGSFVAPAGTLDERGSIGKTEPKQLWQIKTFAFDATKRTSSALILVLYRNSTLRLWKVMKGSPDTIIPLACADQSARSCVLERVACVEANGVRTIVLAAADMTSDLTLVEALFPNGLPSSQASPSSVGEAVQGARDRCDFLHRDVLESSGEGRGSIEIVGIACFEATIRSSTKRVLTGLKAAGLKTTMLTGDSTNAAVSVAAKAGLLSSEHIEILGVDSNEIVGRASRVDRKWPLGGSPLVQSKKRSISSREVRSIIRRVRMGRCCLVATGDAVEMVMGDTLTENLLRDNLNVIDIVARASPKQKQEFVGSLRRSCKKKVLMCGDGVNDVAAMKMSDVAVAMLNGYGDEQILVQQDTENAQRLERITKKRIGSNRRLRTNKATSTEQLGVGQSVSAAAARVKDEMKKSIDGIHESALGRGQRKEVDEGTPVYTMQDIRGIVLAAWQACRNERIRAKTLRKGGAKAAHILAKEDELRRQSSKTSDSNEPVQSSHLRSAIRPGEASLAASFSCLRPSISGVDTLLRTGVAAAACALSVQQTVALNCLMACYNMATLYRDGFRYGKFMWNIEMILFGSINQASYLTSCTPRPVLACSRPPESLFHPESLMLVISQAFIHLVTLNGGVKVANELEIRYSSPIKIPLIRLKRLAGIKSQSQNTLTALLEVLVRNVVFRDAKETRTRGLLKLFRRPPFKPNYTTNFVLVMSVFQNAVSAMMTHSGKPFYGTLLESRKLCLSIAASLFFSVACVSETFPVLNELLELRPMRSHHGQTAFLALFLLDFLACYASRWISTGMSKNDLAGRSELFLSNQDAAAIEEKLLEDEARQNRLMLLGLVGAAWMVTLLTTASAS